MKTIKEFAQESSINEALLRAVIRQCGGWERFKEMAEDVTNHGAAGGFNGFIYYTDTLRFYAANQLLIREMAGELAEQFGTGIQEMVEGFNCLKGSCTSAEVGETLWGRKKDHDQQVANALAWFALEEVCRSFIDITVS